jgi:hypothetical protein
MRQKKIGWRLDYILANEAIASPITQCSVLADIGTSDHAPVVAEFRRNPVRNPGHPLFYSLFVAFIKFELKMGVQVFHRFTAILHARAKT